VTGLRSTAVQAPRDFLYVSVGFPLGLVWLIVLVTLLAVGIGTSVVIIGIPILALTWLLCGWAANSERQRASLILGAPIKRVQRAPLPDGFLAGWKARISDSSRWKEFGYMVALGPVGVITGTIVISLWAAVLAALAAPAFVSTAPPQSVLGRMDTGTQIVVVAGAVVLALITIAITRGLAIGLGAVAKGLLAPDERAQLAARVETLEATRMGAVESADARLRRLERDLHDGAQHRLAYIAMELDRARSKMSEDPDSARELLGRAHEESKRAMVELRDLVRGIHPSVLTDRGLDAAVSGLAQRCPVPVDVTVNLVQRPPVAVETAAYYVVAEALTNVAKHSSAEHAAVEVAGNGRALRILVRDDGGGGAERKQGSGLEGLAQRIEALDGTLVIDSPQGGPTVIEAELPCAS
jgi:signal transduction histidine kinase